MELATQLRLRPQLLRGVRVLMLKILILSCGKIDERISNRQISRR